jgi:hypothetical protein
MACSLSGVVTFGPHHQKLVDIVWFEPTVASKADTVTMEQARVRPAAHRVRVSVETLGNLCHG